MRTLIVCAVLLLGVQGGAQVKAEGPLPVFAVASVRPNKSATDHFNLRFTADGVRVENASVLMIVRAAYGMFNSLDDKFLGMPGWASRERFDVTAKVDPEDVPKFEKLDFEHRQQMVQALLIERFHLKAHQEMRVQAVFELGVEQGGSKLQASKFERAEEISMRRDAGEIVGQEAVISQLVSELSQVLGRTVVNRTGLPGRYDFQLRWTPDELQEGGKASGAEVWPSLFTALKQQLGLKLAAGRAPVECLVIEHIEQPSEN